MRSGPYTNRSRSGLVAVGIGMAAAVLACSTPSEPPQEGPGPIGSRAPSGFYVDPSTAAAAQVRQWETEGRSDDAAELREIAEQPIPLWASGDAAAVEGQVRDYVDRASAAGSVPLLVAYNIPFRDCQSFSGGGAPDGEYYRDWMDALAAGLDGSGAWVVLEPDAVPHELSGCVDGELRDERYALLGDAIEELKAAGATVYLDAGNPGFIDDVDALAGALERSGIAQADGFSLNVANFRDTVENVAFGAAISQRLDGARFVIDTSRNGAGSPGEGDIDGAPSFCNPPGRALGAAPAVDPGIPLVDALLWVKRPGESDGDCRPGEPAAGQWFPDYALELAEASDA